MVVGVPAETSIPDSLIVRSYSTLYFNETGWSKQKKLVEPLVHAFVGTALWEHVGLLCIGSRKAKPRGDVAAISAALMTGKSQYAFIDAGDTVFSDETSAYSKIEIGLGAVQITTCVRGAPLAALRHRALDDFFTMLCALHDDLNGAAHVVCATAWTDWCDNTPAGEGRFNWPLRAIGDVVEPGRPRNDDIFWDAGRAIASAAPPSGVMRATHGGLVMLRWIEDPTDAPKSNAAAISHAGWIKTIVDA
jgi:hypothetical protein